MNETEALKQLEAVDVVESSELAVGHPFHAFKFEINIAKDDELPSEDK